MAGIYQSFRELAQNEQEGVDYQIIAHHRSSGFAIVAPHGGRIEHVTSEIAQGIAGEEYALYCFEGLKDLSHDLHITSNQFDEPQALALVATVDVVITLHGAYGKSPHVYLGGLYEEMKAALITELNRAGFPAAHDPSPTRQGTGKSNICNRGRYAKGVQIEMTQGFRKSLFDKPDYQQTRWRPDDDYFRFVNTIRHVLEAGPAPGSKGVLPANA